MNDLTRNSLSVEENSLTNDIYRHIQFTLGNDAHKPDKYSCYMGLAYSVRDRLIARWLKTQRSFYETLSKRVYYLSLEFLPGRFMKNYITSLGMEDEVHDALTEFGYDLDELEEEEWDAGLGNGGLGRLASCYLDSMATLRLPAYGYGIRYDFGIFHQVIVNGYQCEQSDNWVRRGNPWEFQRVEQVYTVRFYGRSEPYTDENGITRYRWVDTENVIAMACDILVPGYGHDFVSNMRLWTAKSSREFNLQTFNQGDYIGAVEAKVISENISKVLYPSDAFKEGRELRLKQQYFFVSATLLDIIRRFKKQNDSFETFSDSVAIQLNDTHPSIAIPELMRLLVDEEKLPWHEAWKICENTFAYTNHTVLPEALETWPVDIMERVLPRHLEIIFEINYHFIEKVKKRYPDDMEILSKMSIIQEEGTKQVRMAHLAIIGSHSVNGVAALHSHILKTGLFKEFHHFYPDKLKNVTNGITPRRWLYQANPDLSGLITSAIGPDWVSDLSHLKKLVPFADDPNFRSDWMTTKKKNKKRLARYVLRKMKFGVNPDTLFDVHVKRMHEYKRQLLNILHVITLYNRLKDHPSSVTVPRTVFFGGKAAPAYLQAKLIIKLINAVADKINTDKDIKGMLKVLFLPNYCISQAEKVIPAADLSEQISTAGMEASGTGNMKFALNGALTIGTLDGANVEIMEEVGAENIFIFGLKADEVVSLRSRGYNPKEYYNRDPELKKAIDMIRSGYLSPEDPYLFIPIVQSLLDFGDYYLVLADYRSYMTSQDEVARIYTDTEAWCRRSILNTARISKFSSDRAVLEYAKNIWGVRPV